MTEGNGNGDDNMPPVERGKHNEALAVLFEKAAEDVRAGRWIWGAALLCRPDGQIDMRFNTSVPLGNVLLNAGADALKKKLIFDMFQDKAPAIVRPGAPRIHLG